MRLTLLKSSIEPNIDADQEVHEFTYSLYPHGGNWKESNVVKRAYELNCQMYARVEEAHEGNLPQKLTSTNIKLIIDALNKCGKRRIICGMGNIQNLQLQYSHLI